MLRNGNSTTQSVRRTRRTNVMTNIENRKYEALPSYRQNFYHMQDGACICPFMYMDGWKWQSRGKSIHRRNVEIMSCLEAVLC